MATDGKAFERIVTEARSWLGTPFHHAADVKSAGVDCGMLLVRIFVDSGLVPTFDPRPYPQDWFLHRDDERFLPWIETWFRPVTDPECGDVMIFRHGRCFSHGAIVAQADPLTIVHAYSRARAVIEQPFAEALSLHQRDRLLFRYAGDAL